MILIVIVNQNMTDLRPNISVLSINVNGLHSLIKEKFQLDLPSKNQLYAESKNKIISK